MRRYGYDVKLAGATVAMAGTLASLIPPSILMVIYAIITEQSVGLILVAGFIPGFFSAITQCLRIIVRVKLDPRLAPPGPSFSWRERFISLKGVWGISLLILIVMGGIYSGVFTPTEAGAMGAAGALVITLMARSMGWANLRESLLETGRTTGMLFMIVIGAFIMIQFLAVSRLPTNLAEFLVGLQVNRYLVLMGVYVLYIVLGCFMEGFGMMLLTLPFIYPSILALGFDGIWFGVIMVVLIEIGLLTPPVGLNIYVVKALLPDVSLETLFRGIGWFLIVDFINLAIFTAFPQIVLFLPHQMMK